ncbi:7665_t:CDS:1, partial [Gigaspora rosea]
CLFVPNSEIAKEFSNIEELRQMIPQQVLHQIMSHAVLLMILQ